MVSTHPPEGASEQADTRILLVEDNPGDVRLIREALLESGEEGLSIQCVTSLQAALEAAGEGGIDLVLLDLRLPDSFGIETLTKFATQAPDLPIVVLTGLEDRELAAQAVAGSAQEFVAKSQVQGQHLLRVMRQAIERKRGQAEMSALVHSLQEASARARDLITASADGILVLDTTGRILFANPAATMLLGSRAEQALERVIRSTLAEGDTIEVALSGDQIVEIRVVAIEWEQAPAYLASVRDITSHSATELALKKLNSRLQATNSNLQKLAFADPLTELLNRRGMEHMLRNEVGRCQRKRSPLTACLVDCDSFKQINEAHGHVVGDCVLHAVGSRLAKCLRLSDHLARIGGDEFLVLLPETDFGEGYQIASRMRASIGDEPLQLPEGAVQLTVSVGVALVPPECSSIQDVIRATETALKTSKSKGKNRVTGAPRNGLGDSNSPDHAPAPELLREGGLRAVFHPILRLADEQVEGYELLSRGPRGPWEMPDKFFRVWTDQEHLTALDLHCLKTCLEEIDRADLPGRMQFHVNLFPITIVETPIDQLLDLFAIVKRSVRICIELNEQQFAGDMEPLRQRMRALHAEGISIAIDDVGYGRSALETLVLLEPDIVKLDRHCVLGVAADDSKRDALRRLVHVARALGCEPIAEGIELAEDVAALHDLGVLYGQGFLWGRPGPLT